MILLERLVSEGHRVPVNGLLCFGAIIMVVWVLRMAEQDKRK